MLKKIGSLVVLIGCLYTAEITLDSSVDRTSVPVNQTVQYTISFEGSSNLPGLQLPPLNDFIELGQSASTQFQIINGRQSAAQSLIYTLQPKKQGKAVIPALKFTRGSDVYNTKALEITVTAYVTVNQQTNPVRYFFGGRDFQNVSAKLVAQDKTLVIGQKTILKLEIEHARPFYQGPAYEFPKVEGFVQKDPVESKPDKNGNLIVQEIYPLEAGEYTLPAARVQYVDSPFTGVQTLQTEPIIFNVKKLPIAPENFSGAVGSFDLEGSWLAKKILNRTGESISLKLKVSGVGNLDMINDLNLPASENYQVYLENVDPAGTNGLKAVRTFTYLITPLVPGKFKLPAISFVFYDHNKGVYVSKKIQLKEFEVKGEFINKKVVVTDLDTDSALVLFQKIIKVWHWFLKIIPYLGAMFLIFLAGMFGYRLKNAPRRQALEQLRRLENLIDADFAIAAEKLFLEIGRLNGLNLRGLSSEQLAKLPSKYAVPARIILVKLEESRFARGQISQDKAEIIKNLKLFLK